MAASSDPAPEPDVAALVRELYAAEPAEFVATRKRLASGLKADGHRDAAATLGKLRKPTVVEDALNRTARTDADDVAAWASAVAAASAAQSTAIGGGGSDDLRAATTDLRASSTALVRAATRHAGAGKAGDISALLQTLTNETGVALVRHGVLGSEEDVDTELFAGAPDPPERQPAEKASGPSKRTSGKASPRTAAAAGADDDEAGLEADEGPKPEAAPRPVRGPSAQSRKRHAAAVDKATRARVVAAREVGRLEAELSGARQRLEKAERSLADVESSAPS